MACGIGQTETCVMVRPDDFSSNMASYDAEISYYDSLVSELEKLNSNMDMVSTKLSNCVAANLKIGITGGLENDYVDAVERYSKDIQKECSNIEESIRNAKSAAQTARDNKNNYNDTAWIQKCSCI